MLFVAVLFPTFMPSVETPKTDRDGCVGPADMGEGWFDRLTNHARHVRRAHDVGLEFLVLLFQDKRTEIDGPSHRPLLSFCP